MKNDKLIDYIVKKENRMLKNLEPQEFVFCLFLIGLHRRIPGMSHYASEISTTKMANDLPGEIEAMLLSLFSQFSLPEMGILAHSLHNASLYPHEPLQARMLDYLNSVPDIAHISDYPMVITNIFRLSVKFDKNEWENY